MCDAWVPLHVHGRGRESIDWRGGVSTYGQSPTKTSLHFTEAQRDIEERRIDHKLKRGKRETYIHYPNIIIPPRKEKQQEQREACLI